MRAKEKEQHVDIDLLHKMFHYDRETGRLTRKISRSNRVKVGTEPGYITGYGYRMIHLAVGERKLKIHAHRIIWAMVYGKFPENQIDHINGNRLDNRIENLRSVKNRENGKNQKLRSTNKTGIHGLYWDAINEAWTVQIYFDNKKIWLGRHKDFFDAACVRKSAEVRFGYHQNHGEIR